MTLFLVLLALQCQDCSTQCVGCTNQEVYQYPALPKMAYVPSSNLDSSEKLGGVKKKNTHTHTHTHTRAHTLEFEFRFVCMVTCRTRRSFMSMAPRQPQMPRRTRPPCGKGHEKQAFRRFGVSHFEGARGGVGSHGAHQFYRSLRQTAVSLIRSSWI